jgi:hypothetical protein
MNSINQIFKLPILILVCIVVCVRSIKADCYNSMDRAELMQYDALLDMIESAVEMAKDTVAKRYLLAWIANEREAINVLISCNMQSMILIPVERE